MARKKAKVDLSSTWQIEQGVSPNAHKISFPGFQRAEGEAGYERWALVMSDLHWDSPHCNRELLKLHLDQANERGAVVVCHGDLFCCMNGRFDPRRSMSNVRPEHRGDDYLDLILETAEEWFKPYAHLLAVISPGNHETAILKNNNVAMIQHFVSRMKRLGSRCMVGGYSGYIRWQFNRQHWRQSKTMYYHHGFGGGGWSSKGATQFTRLPESVTADIYVMGHIHRLMTIPTVRQTLSRHNRIVREPVLYLRTSTYKDEIGTGEGGWATEKGMGARPLGSYWLRFRYCERVVDGRRAIYVDTKAIGTEGW